MTANKNGQRMEALGPKAHTATMAEESVRTVDISALAPADHASAEGAKGREQEGPQGVRFFLRGWRDRLRERDAGTSTHED